MEATLTTAQLAALDHVRQAAVKRRAPSEAALSAELGDATSHGSLLRTAVGRLGSGAQVALAFHPERETRPGRSVVDGLVEDRVYKNQFETGLSGGSTSARPGGRRDEWERHLFGGAYHRPGVALSERPKYGALVAIGHLDGPCPRFGSSYVVLRPEVSARCSFTVLGSQEGERLDRSGTLDAPEAMLAALATHVGEVPAPLGVPGLTFEALLRGMGTELPIPPDSVGAGHLGRALDTFVEAQVHGVIDLQRDVAALVVDASFAGSALGVRLRELSAVCGFPLRWHPGFTLPAADFPESFRGFPTRIIADRAEADGLVDAPSLGEAQNRFLADPDAWPEFTNQSDALTSFRRVWHYMVLFGRPSPQWQSLTSA